MQKDGLNERYVHLDVTSEPDWNAGVKTTISEFGKLDILIMAVGIPDRGETVDSTPIDKWRRVMDVTNLGMFLGTRTVVGPMKEASGGSIVLISSMMAKVARDQANAYAASRARMTHFARSVGVQYGPDNIRVNSVLPGWTYTPFTAPAFG